MVNKSSYANRIQQSQEEKDQQAVKSAVKKAELQLQADIIATEESLVNAETNLELAKAAIPFNSQAIINAKIAVESAENGLKELQAIKLELFPASK